jgi:hypothetical protein
MSLTKQGFIFEKKFQWRFLASGKKKQGCYSYPLDFWEDEYVVNTICSFGRVISWVDDGRHLPRILVRARVVDLESIS